MQGQGGGENAWAALKKGLDEDGGLRVKQTIEIIV